ncbi:MAG TPA: hypothetical protein VKF32_04790, partial [Thermoanaerobaculia bacterium]|nr:hypothetical protein [Thermoanaerobaculia bacterium]
MRTKTLLLLAVAAFLPSARAAAQPFGPGGAAFRVNTYTSNYQDTPSIAFDASGAFLVVWLSANEDGSTNGIYAQRYTAASAPAGPEFRVNTYTTHRQVSGHVVAGGAGAFTVAWESENQSSFSAVYAQRLLGGVPQGGEFRVDTTGSEYYVYPAIAADAPGNFVVVWAKSLGLAVDVFGQRFQADGSALGGEFRVNAVTTGTQTRPAVARAATGEFVVVWQEYGQLGGGTVNGRRFDAAGAPLASDFRVDDGTGATQQTSVAVSPSGAFVVVWAENVGAASIDVLARRYAAGGAPLTGSFRVNGSTTGNQSYAKAAFGPDGGFVVVWKGGDGSGYGVFGQRYAVDGSPLGGEFRVNRYTTGGQVTESVAYAPSGDFVVVFAGVQGGSDYDVFAQRLCKGQAGDVNASGTIDVADV